VGKYIPLCIKKIIETAKNDTVNCPDSCGMVQAFQLQNRVLVWLMVFNATFMVI
jgi:hypothetical protein